MPAKYQRKFGRGKRESLGTAQVSLPPCPLGLRNATMNVRALSGEVASSQNELLFFTRREACDEDGHAHKTQTENVSLEGGRRNPWAPKGTGKSP